MRLRQHTNPFSYRDGYKGPPPNEILGGPPSELEIGPGYGELLVARAKQEPTARILGVELRVAYVEICNSALAEAGLTNACAIHAEARMDLPQLVADESLDVIYLMFPDPWFKRRHHKRRVLDSALIEVIVRKLRVGGELHFATDNRALTTDVFSQLAGEKRLIQAGDVPPAAALSGRGIHHGKLGHSIFGGRFARLVPGPAREA